MSVKENPSGRLVLDLLSSTYSKALQALEVEFKGIVLPVEYNKAFAVLKKEVKDFEPDLVVSFGVAQSRNKICLERIAVNHRSKSLNDNSGFVPESSKIIENAPDGLFSNIQNIDELSADLKQKGWSVEVSSSAGDYVCNALMFESCLLAKEKGFLYDFIHIPDSHMYSKLNTQSKLDLPSFVLDLLKALKTRI